MEKILLTDPYQVLINYDALYESPKDRYGQYLGPLVAYAGIEPRTGKNWVGFAYYNIAKVEQPPETRNYFSKILSKKIKQQFDRPTIIIGAPMGGLIFATSTADQLECDVAFFEKKVTQLADPTNHTKEKSELIFNRHILCSYDKVIIFEDVCNNFTTTDQMIDLIASKGAKILAIVCIVNRSSLVEWKGIPVISALHLPTDEFSQTDLEVQKLIADGKIVWKPKAEWEKLRKAMG